MNRRLIIKQMKLIAVAFILVSLTFLASVITHHTPKNNAKALGTPATITKKVMVLNFDPLINGVELHRQQGWNDPVALDNQHILDLKAASHGIVSYQVTDYRVIRDYPYKPGGFKFTQAQYLGCLTNDAPAYCLQIIDYNRLLNDYNVCGLVNNGTIDELWLWGAPYFGYYEAIMAGPGAFHTNGPPVSGTSCQKKLNIMGFSYERGSYEMMHDFGHRAEGVLEHLFGGDPYGLQPNLSNPWNRFWLYAKAFPGKGACGNIHRPPNTHYSDTSNSTGYDYANTDSALSYCEDWLNYPSTKGVQTVINCNSWGCSGSGSGPTSNFFEKWWLTHLPYKSGSTNNILNNWWAYIVDYDNAVARTGREPEKWYVINNSAQDVNTGCATNYSDDNIYLGQDSRCAYGKYNAFFNFANVQVARGAYIGHVYLEFIADGPYTNPITEKITLTDGTTTSQPISWIINSNWPGERSIVRSPDLRSALTQVTGSTTWTPGRTITATITHTSGAGARRVFGFDRDPNTSARLIVELSSSPPTTPPSPGTPTAQTPTGSIACVTGSAAPVNFGWGIATNAATYFLRIDDLSNGWNQCGGSVASLPGDYCINNITGNSYIKNLPINKSYKWWVSGVNSAGVQGGLSSQVNFNIPNVCLPAPTPTSPQGTLTCSRQSTAPVAFRWSSVTGASSYYLRIDDTSNGWVICGTGQPNPGDKCISSIGNTSYSLNLPVGKSYKWWVSGVRSNGENGTLSSQITFNLPACK